MTLYETVKEAYAKATGRFTGADWSHNRRIWLSNSWDTTIPWECRSRETEKPCDGLETCAVCEVADEAAVLAENYARRAGNAAREGNWDEAVEYARAASAKENSFGDNPVWGPFLEAVLKAAEKQSVMDVSYA